jgi:RNA polymerase sigma factor (sigma-70 family)
MRTRQTTPASGGHWHNFRDRLNFPPMNAESQLLARCLRGEAAAWDELFDAHYAAAGRFIFQVSSSFTSEDVEEICQETFLTVIKSLGSFQGNCQFQTWLFRIAANKAHDYIQKQRAAKRGGGQKTISLNAPVNGEPDGFTIDPPSHAPGPDRALVQIEDAGLITRALEELGGPCQEVIELRYFADLSYEEISAELKLNPKTVSSRLSKCLDKLEGVAAKYFPGAKEKFRERKKTMSV